MAKRKTIDRVLDLVRSSVTSQTLVVSDDFINQYANLMEDEVGSADMFLLYIMRRAGVSTLAFPNLKTSGEVIAWMRKRNRYTVAGTGDPAVGDLVYHMSKSGSAIGIVVGVTEDKVTFIAGSGPVNSIAAIERTMLKHSGLLYGYMKVDYEMAETKGAIPSTQLSSLVKGTMIIEFKRWMNETYGSALDETLAETKTMGKNVIRHIIECWRLQLCTDRKISIPTRTKELFTGVDQRAGELRELKVRTSGNMVRLLQYILYAHGYDPKSTSGRFDNDTKAAVLAFQHARSLTETGVVSSNVWEQLLTRW